MTHPPSTQKGAVSITGIYFSIKTQTHLQFYLDIFEANKREELLVPNNLIQNKIHIDQTNM